jgi:hypothetical protein
MVVVAEKPGDDRQMTSPVARPPSGAGAPLSRDCQRERARLRHLRAGVVFRTFTLFAGSRH